MPYVVTENCIKCKYMDCVEVCPVDCFYEGDNMLVIHPDDASTAASVSRSARQAIIPDSDAEAEKWLEIQPRMSR